MIDRLLRSVSVRFRIVGGFLILILFLAAIVPVVVTSYSSLVNRVRQVSSVDSRIDRLLLLASTRISSSQINLVRYLEDYTLSPFEALDDADQAVGMLEEARTLVTSQEQIDTIDLLLQALVDYRALIDDVETAREEDDSQTVTRLQFQAIKLGNDIGQRIEIMVGDSEARVVAANEAVFSEGQRRLTILTIGGGGIIFLALILIVLVSRSITRPITELHEGAEAFRQGEMETVVPESGNDELSLLARTLNQLIAQLSASYQDLEQRVADRTGELTRRTVQLETTAQVAREASAIRDVKSLLNRAVRLISDRFGFYHAGIFLIDDAGEYAILQAASSEGGQRMLDRGHRLRVGQVGIVGIVAGTGKPRIALDVGVDAVFFDNPDLPPTRSEMALPLKVRDRVIGIFDVQSMQEAAFSEDDIEILQILADQLALALENARLFEESQQALRELGTLYGQKTRRTWEQRLQRGSSVFLYNRLGVEAVEPSQVVKEPVEISTEPRVLTEDGSHKLLVPIAVRDQVLGTVVLRREADQDPWSDDELALAVETITQIAPALENARLLEETQYLAEREQIVNIIATEVRSTINLDAILQNTVRELGKTLGVSRTFIQLGMDQELEPSPEIES